MDGRQRRLLVEHAGGYPLLRQERVPHDIFKANLTDVVQTGEEVVYVLVWLVVEQGDGQSL